MIGLIKKDIYLILKNLSAVYLLAFLIVIIPAIFPVSYDSFYADRSYNGS